MCVSLDRILVSPYYVIVMLYIHRWRMHNQWSYHLYVILELVVVICVGFTTFHCRFCVWRLYTRSWIHLFIGRVDMRIVLLMPFGVLSVGWSVVIIVFLGSDVVIGGSRGDPLHCCLGNIPYRVAWPLLQVISIRCYLCHFLWASFLSTWAWDR